jgi:hypothetical protein
VVKGKRVRFSEIIVRVDTIDKHGIALVSKKEIKIRDAILML